MHKYIHSRLHALCLLGLTACGSGGASGRRSDTGTPESDGGVPLGGAAIERWLRTGEYLHWHCESRVHASRNPCPHGFNRICSNDLVASNAEGRDPFPQGAAAVKELYASADGKEPVGYAVYVKTQGDSANGANSYWYERVPLDNAVPHDPEGIVADGMGDQGSAKAICVGCHAAAGTDAAHSPSKGGRDEVYTPVM
jgi:hypothetical protein